MKSYILTTTLLYLTALTSALPPLHYAQEQNPSIHRTPDTASSLDFLSSLDPGFSSVHRRDLEKRRGGGGGKGGGKGGSSGSGGTIGGRPASSYSFSPSSNAGGRTIGGSGTPPSYGGRYAGGAAVPYTAGTRSPTRGVTPFLLPAAGFAFFPGIWLYGVYSYPYYGYGYNYYDNGRNRTANVTCLCQQYSECGCDPDGTNNTSIASQLTNGVGSGAPVNSTRVQTVDYNNGTIVSYINGTLDNGTTATGGTDPSNEDEVSAAITLAASKFGPWIVSAVVVAACGFIV